MYWSTTLIKLFIVLSSASVTLQNRVGSVSQLQFELGKILCDVSSCDSFVLAG